MSFAAIRWALAQPVAKASTKFLLVAMADCVNTDNAAAWRCWPSYRYLAQRTGLDFKTVESGVYRLKELGYLKDTGQRAGSTGKVVVYQLNTPENGVVISGPEGEGEPRSQHANGPEIGVVKPESNDPEIPSNPPKFPAQRPRNSSAMTPKTGSGSSNGTSNGTRKKQVNGAMPRPTDVTEQTWTDWTALRAKKRTTVSETAVNGARAEAAKAGLSLEQFLALWVTRGSQGMQADWIKPAERARFGAVGPGFDHKDYHAGVKDGQLV